MGKQQEKNKQENFTLSSPDQASSLQLSAIFNPQRMKQQN